MKTVTIEIDVKNDLSRYVKNVWEQVKQIELQIANKEGKKIEFPAIYGVAAASLFPMLSLAMLYSLTKADLRISLEKAN